MAGRLNPNSEDERDETCDRVEQVGVLQASLHAKIAWNPCKTIERVSLCQDILQDRAFGKKSERRSGILKLKINLCTVNYQP
jgi:hypothetical protein